MQNVKLLGALTAVAAILSPAASAHADEVWCVDSQSAIEIKDKVLLRIKLENELVSLEQKSAYLRDTLDKMDAGRGAADLSSKLADLLNHPAWDDPACW